LFLNLLSKEAFWQNGIRICYNINIPAVKGHHVYKEVWTPVLGKELAVNKEEDNGYDCYAVSIIINV